MRVLRRAWTVCRLTGSLHFPARRNQRGSLRHASLHHANRDEPVRRVVSMDASLSAIRRSDDAPCMRCAAFPVLPGKHHELRRSFRKWANATERVLTRRPRNGRQCLRKTFLISNGSETTLDCLAADRAAVECPEHLSLRRQPTMKVEKMRIPPTALGPGKRAKCSAWAGCLGIAGRLQSSPTPFM